MPALVALGLSVLPSLARWMLGDTVGDVAGKIADVIKGVTGTDDPEQAKAAMQNEEIAAKVRVQLAQIQADKEDAYWKAQTEMFQASTADAASARAMSSTSPLIARTQVTLAYMIIAANIAVVGFMLIHGVPQDQGNILYYVLATLNAGLVTVMGFFFGNSTASHSANTTLANIAAQPAPQPATPVATTGDVVIGNASPLGTTAATLNNQEYRRHRR